MLSLLSVVLLVDWPKHRVFRLAAASNEPIKNVRLVVMSDGYVWGGLFLSENGGLEESIT